MPSSLPPVLLLLVPTLAFLPAALRLPARRPAAARVWSTLPWSAEASPRKQQHQVLQTPRAPRTRDGRLTFEGFGPDGAAVGETITVVYNPRGQGADPPISLAKAEGPGTGTVAEDATPCLLYGFNGWDGEDKPFATPFFPLGEEDGGGGCWAANVILPNYARVLDCIVSDGRLAYDTNGGEYFHLRITHVQQPGPDGQTYLYRQGEDGSLVPEGVLEANDAQELERMIEEELARRQSPGGGGEAAVVAAAASDIHHEEEEEEPLLVDRGDSSGAVVLPSSSLDDAEDADVPSPIGSTGVALSAHAADAASTTQQLRAEATLIGQSLGLSSLVLNEVREAFDTVAPAGAYTLSLDEAGRALDRLGFDEYAAPASPALAALYQRVVGGDGGGGPGDADVDGVRVTLELFMRMFHALDAEDCGIVII